MQESLREAENKKRTLEENIDTLQSQFAKMKAAGIKKLYFLIIYNYCIINLRLKLIEKL